MKRYCSQCFEEKPLQAFYIDRGRPTAACKACRLAMGHMTPEERRAHRQKRAAADNAWLAAYLADPSSVSHRGEWPADEIWRPVARYIGKYEVSDQGRVRSLWFANHRAHQLRAVPWVLMQFTHASGYRSVSLVGSPATRGVTELVHQLVCEAFRGPRPDGLVCGHRDGDPGNNRAHNLAWITYTENEADKQRHGHTLTGSKNHQSKLTEDDVRRMRELRATGVNYADLGKQFGVSGAVAHRAVTGRSWKHVA